MAERTIMDIENTIYILDPEQPECCPRCGTRVDINDEWTDEEDGLIHQWVTCLNPKCRFEYETCEPDEDEMGDEDDE